MTKEIVITCPSCDGQGYVKYYDDGNISQDIPIKEYKDGCNRCGGSGSKKYENGHRIQNNFKKGSGKLALKIEVTDNPCYRYGGIPRHSFMGGSYQEKCHGKYSSFDMSGKFLGEGICPDCYGTGNKCNILEEKPKSGWF